MREPLSARTHRPVLPDHLVPNRPLERRLDYLAETRPVIWIAAPPRSGKRTAIGSWLQSSRRAARWHQGRGEGLVDAVVGELAELRQDSGGRSPGETPVTVVVEGTPVAEAEVDCLERILSERPGVRVVVLDDRRPETAAETRRSPEVTESDLALTAPAIASGADQLGVEVSEAVVGVLVRHYAGNPALVGAVLANRRTAPADDPELALALAHSAEAVALMTVLLGDAGAEVAALLALAGEVPEAVAEALGHDGTRSALRMLWERGLIGIDAGGRPGELVYRLPASVRELVRASTLPRYLDQRPRLHRLAAEAAIARGALADAVRFLTTAGEPRSGVELFCEQWDRLHHGGEWDQLLAVFELLDPDAVLESAEACAALTIIRVVSGRLPAIEPFETRVRTVPEKELGGLTLRGRTTVRVAQAHLLVAVDRAEAAGRRMAEAFEHYEASDPRDRLELRGVHLELALAGAQAALFRGALRRSVELYDEALVLADYTGSVVGLYRAVAGRALALALSGEFAASTAAARRATELRDRTPALAALPVTELAWCSAIARVHTAGDDLDLAGSLALDEVEDGGAGNEVVAALRRYLEVRRLIAAGRVFDAIGLLRSWLGSVLAPLRPVPLLRDMVLQTLALAFVMTNQAGAALLALEGERNNENHIPCLSRVRPLAYLVQGSPREALAETEECVALGHEHSLLSLPYVFIVRALAFEALELPSSAEDALRSALGIILETGARIDLRTCLGKNLSPVIRRLRAVSPELVARAERQLTGVEAEGAAPNARLVRLTPKEREILVLLAGPETIGGIASALYLSENTVKTHVRSIYAKLGVGSRREAVDVASGWGIAAGDGGAESVVDAG